MPGVVTMTSEKIKTIVVSPVTPTHQPFIFKPGDLGPFLGCDDFNWRWGFVTVWASAECHLAEAILGGSALF